MKSCSGPSCWFCYRIFFRRLFILSQLYIVGIPIIPFFFLGRFHLSTDNLSMLSSIQISSILQLALSSVVRYLPCTSESFKKVSCNIVIHSYNSSRKFYVRSLEGSFDVLVITRRLESAGVLRNCDLKIDRAHIYNQVRRLTS